MAGGRWDYRVEEAAEREIRLLPEHVREEAIDLLESMIDDPILGAMEMRRYKGYYRLYFGDDKYRLIFRVPEVQDLHRGSSAASKVCV